MRSSRSREPDGSPLGPPLLLEPRRTYTIFRHREEGAVRTRSPVVRSQVIRGLVSIFSDVEAILIAWHESQVTGPPKSPRDPDQVTDGRADR
jgi:hypothetical protein